MFGWQDVWFILTLFVMHYLQNICGWSMGPIVVTAEWRCTTVVSGNEYAAATGTRQKLMLCARKLTAAIRSLRPHLSTMEIPEKNLQSK